MEVVILYLPYKSISHVLTFSLARKFSTTLASPLPWLSAVLDLFILAFPAHTPSLCLLALLLENQERGTANSIVSTFQGSKKDRVLLRCAVGLQCCVIYILLAVDS